MLTPLAKFNPSATTASSTYAWYADEAEEQSQRASGFDRAYRESEPGFRYADLNHMPGRITFQWTIAAMPEKRLRRRRRE
jgi:hypothetical protein